jgi:hypothetical protein
MSPESGTPAAATKCNGWPPNDLRWRPCEGQKQIAKSLERHSYLSHVAGDTHDKTQSPDAAAE